MMRKKILFSITSQFGYHTDTYFYCLFLDNNKYEITYICFDLGLRRFLLNNVEVKYIPVHKNIFKRYLDYVKRINIEIKNGNYDIVFQVDCQASFLIRLLNLNQKMVLDFRTGNLNRNILYRKLNNLTKSITSLFYENITCVSEEIGSMLSLNKNKMHIIPLGGILQKNDRKSIECINLLYVGIFDKRKIEDTIYGLYLATQLLPHIKFNYDIIGYGSYKYTEKLKKAVREKNMFEIVKIHDRKYHEELIQFYNYSNIGVAYIPKRDYYNKQPSTKLFEYFLAGMPVIATDTLANKKYLTLFSGEFCQDNPKSFCNALLRIYKNRHNYDSEVIKKYYLDYTWQNIVKNNLEIYLDGL